LIRDIIYSVNALADGIGSMMTLSRCDGEFSCIPDESSTATPICESPDDGLYVVGLIPKTRPPRLRPDGETLVQTH